MKVMRPLGRILNVWELYIFAMSLPMDKISIAAYGGNDDLFYLIVGGLSQFAFVVPRHSRAIPCTPKLTGLSQRFILRRRRAAPTPHSP